MLVVPAVVTFFGCLFRSVLFRHADTRKRVFVSWPTSAESFRLRRFQNVKPRVNMTGRLQSVVRSWHRNLASAAAEPDMCVCVRTVAPPVCWSNSTPCCFCCCHCSPAIRPLPNFTATSSQCCKKTCPMERRSHVRSPPGVRVKEMRQEAECVACCL